MVKLGCAAKQMPLGCKNAKLFLIEPLPANKCTGRKYKKDFINENRHIAVKNSINNAAAYNCRHHTKNHNTYFPAYVHLFYLLHCYAAVNANLSKTQGKQDTCQFDNL